MKLKSIVCSVLLCAFLTFFMGGCDITDFSTDSLYARPKQAATRLKLNSLSTKPLKRITR